MRNLILPSIFAVAVLGACGGGTTPMDMATAPDMAGLKVRAPAASCVQATATSAQVFEVFNGLAGGKCRTSNC